MFLNQTSYLKSFNILDLNIDWLIKSFKINVLVFIYVDLKFLATI